MRIDLVELSALLADARRTMTWADIAGHPFTDPGLRHLVEGLAASELAGPECFAYLTGLPHWGVLRVTSEELLRHLERGAQAWDEVARLLEADKFPAEGLDLRSLLDGMLRILSLDPLKTVGPWRRPELVKVSDVLAATQAEQREGVLYIFCAAAWVGHTRERFYPTDFRALLAHGRNLVAVVGPILAGMEATP